MVTDQQKQVNSSKKVVKKKSLWQDWWKNEEKAQISNTRIKKQI